MDALCCLAGMRESCGIENFEDKLKAEKKYPLKAGNVEIFQMNLGKKCNLACRHCHVDAGPARTEMMPRGIFGKCLEIIKDTASINTIDITGGAPEMNPNLKWFIKEASKTGKRLIVRSNLAILAEKEYEAFIDLYAERDVEICVSLPDYSGDKTARQRGSGVYDKIISVMKILNQKGYGTNKRRILDIAHNPAGAYLPGDQKTLEHDYRTYLKREHGIIFNNLFSITNMPVGRYLEYLQETDNIGDYMRELAGTYNPQAVGGVMCRTTISVSWDGTLYDCDFNQMLGLGVSGKMGSTVFNFDPEALTSRDIVTRNHCYGCTAGAGSSCQGSIG
jgi:radical SAM/Cys-rich protein